MNTHALPCPTAIERSLLRTCETFTPRREPPPVEPRGITPVVRAAICDYIAARWSGINQWGLVLLGRAMRLPYERDAIACIREAIACARTIGDQVWIEAIYADALRGHRATP